jgi:hypothetical protein
MKRRSVLRSLLALPSIAALPAEAVAQEARPAASETPNTATTGADASSDPLVRMFDKAQFSALRKLGEILMPASKETPGAVEAGAAEFLDFLLGVSPADRLTLYKSGLDRLNSEAQQRYHQPFAEITAAQADPILAPLHAPWSYRGPTDTFAKFLLAAKSDLMEATVNSREYIAVAAQRGRRGGGVGQYWYPIE